MAGTTPVLSSAHVSTPTKIDASTGHPQPPPIAGLPGRPQPHRGLRVRLGHGGGSAPRFCMQRPRRRRTPSHWNVRAANLEYVRNRTSVGRVAPHSDVMLAELVDKTRLGRVIGPAKAPSWWPGPDQPDLQRRGHGRPGGAPRRRRLRGHVLRHPPGERERQGQNPTKKGLAALVTQRHRQGVGSRPWSEEWQTPKTTSTSLGTTY